MNIIFIINRIYIFVSCFVSVLAVLFLTISIVYRHQCFNFPTLLACNTAFATLLYSCDNLAVGIYMLLWEEQSVVHIDSLCSLRAYIHHATIASVHHSFVLQATEKYVKIKRLSLLNSHMRKVFMVLLQWIFDFMFVLPIYLTGNMPKFPTENMCFVSLTNIGALVYLFTISFILSDITLSILYRRLVSYVRESSSRINGNQERMMRRDLVMVRRVVLLNSQLLLVGIPSLIFVIISIVRLDLSPPNWMRLLLTAVNAAFAPMLIILFLITPSLRQIFINILNKVKQPLPNSNNRVRPTEGNNRF